MVCVAAWGKAAGGAVAAAQGKCTACPQARPAAPPKHQATRQCEPRVVHVVPGRGPAASSVEWGGAAQTPYYQWTGHSGRHGRRRTRKHTPLSSNFNIDVGQTSVTIGGGKKGQRGRVKRQARLEHTRMVVYDPLISFLIAVDPISVQEEEVEAPSGKRKEAPPGPAGKEAAPPSVVQGEAKATKKARADSPRPDDGMMQHTSF